MAQINQLIKRVLVALNIDLHLKSHDRKVLEGQIIPWLRTLPDSDRVLFVGTEWYTRGYRKFFQPGTYWTMDYDPRKAIYGSSLHVTDSMVNVASHFAPGSLDVVICNGVFGWGLDYPPDIEVAFGGTASALRSQGLFLVGWNDTPARKPMELENVQALKAFRPLEIGPLGTSRFRTTNPNGHTFNLYQKL